MTFKLYDFVGLNPNQKIKTIIKNLDQIDNRVYFVREILENDVYICDVYDGENRVENHYEIKLDLENYEKKNIRATFKIREYYPDTGTFVDNPTVFTSIESVLAAGARVPAFAIWNVSIVCDTDCKALGIDPTAPWPPKAV